MFYPTLEKPRIFKIVLLKDQIDKKLSKNIIAKIKLSPIDTYNKKSSAFSHIIIR